jgi:hypothetical protein
MSDQEKRYPLSTPDGRAIPFEVLRPLGFISKTFTSAGSTASIAIPATVQVLSVYATEECIVTFAASGASAAAIVDGTLVDDTVFIPAETLMVLSPPIDFAAFAIRGVSANGTARIQFIDHWAGLALASQYIRR